MKWGRGRSSDGLESGGLEVAMDWSDNVVEIVMGWSENVVKVVMGWSVNEVEVVMGWSRILVKMVCRGFVKRMFEDDLDKREKL